MNPSDSQYGPVKFRPRLIFTRLRPCAVSVLGLPHCAALLPIHAIPATPGDPPRRFRSLKLGDNGLPLM